MSLDAARVAWTEGLFLRPQHFQQQERHLEWLLFQRLQQALPFAWGFSDLALDETLRAQGKLALRSATGVLRDGTPFQVPSRASPVAPLEVPLGTVDAVVHLHAVVQRPDARAFALDEAGVRRARYLARDVDVVDNATEGGDSASIKLGSLALGLTFEHLLDGAATTLPVARIRKRTAAGLVELDEDFIPPMLDAGNQARLRGWIDELSGLVKLRGNLLAQRIAHQGAKPGDFLLLQLCNRHEPLLAQWRAGVPVHPLQLHQVLLQFAGEVRTVDPRERRALSFPTYQHEAPAASFEPVLAEIRRALVDVPEETGERIPIIALHGGYLGAELIDTRILQQGYLVLGMTARRPDEFVRTELPKMIRIGSTDDIKDLIDSQTPGIPLRHLGQVPGEIRYSEGHQYFRLRVEDYDPHFFKVIQANRRLVFFVAGDTPGVELELWWVRSTPLAG